MRLKTEVEEQAMPTTTLQVYHRRLRIPREIYLETVADFSDPWEERACQFFVQEYLQELNDSGIVGMVRQDITDSFIFLDAAVRYPQDPL